MDLHHKHPQAARSYEKTTMIMKRILLLTSICCMLTGVVQAASVSGTVTNATTGLPASGVAVLVTDSLKSFTDSVITNSAGFYLDSLPTPMSARTLIISTTACGVLHSANRFFNGVTSITQNFTVCVPAITFTLHGSVLLDSLPNNGPGTVYLIRKQYDSLLLDTTLTVIDSMSTAPTGGAFTKTYTAIPPGTLLLKAALHPSHPYYSVSLPTYYGAALVWSLATPLSTTNFSSSTVTNITMMKGVNPGGPGFIGGSVLVGANKTTAVGDPLADRILILTTSAGKPVAYTYSNVSGLFQFTNLAYGTYKIFGDAWGKTNPALTVTITAVRPSISNVLFEENNKTFRGTLTLGIGNSSLDGVSIYPNPATDHIQFNGLTAIGGSKTVILSDITGAVITRRTIEQGESPVISTAALSAGMYMLRLQTTGGSASFKIVK